MANKLYEENDIQAIADAIRANTSDGDKYFVSEMAAGVQKVYNEGYSKGLLAGSGNSGGESQGLEYTLMWGDEYYVSGIGTCTDVDIIIPSTHNGLPVTGIASTAFERTFTIKSVIIPDSVHLIQDFAFYEAVDLEKIYIPSSVTTIDQAAFVLCDYLTIYCEAASKPDGWNEGWKESYTPVVWNAVNDIWEINDKFNSLGNGNTGGGDDPSTPEVVPSSLEMPLIRFIGLRGNNYLSNLDGEEQPVNFVIGIIAGSLQVGDTLQICGMRTFSPSEKNPIKKRKLRRFAEYEITESDLNKKSLTLTVYPTKNVFAFLAHNNRQSGGPCDYFFRIRRPVGDLQANESGMSVDAKFSNVVGVAMLNVTGDTQEDEEGNKFMGVKINVV